MQTLQELFVEEIRDLYDAEKQLVKALPKFAKAATDRELKAALTNHLDVTRNQVTRLEQVFEIAGETAKGKPCKGMKGLIEEGQEMTQEEAADEVMDLAIIGAAQRVEHYEIAGYGTARTFAEKLGLSDAAEILDQIADEEGEADKKLTAISERLLEEFEVEESEEAEEEEAVTAGRSSRK